MGRWTQILNWMGAAVTRDDCLGNRHPPKGTIEVYVASDRPDERPCILGGQVHCPHGKTDCCWCALRQRNRN